MKTNSARIIFLSSVICLLVILNLGNYKRLNIIKEDVVIYYSYLPAFFIKHDLKLTFMDDANSNVPSNSYWGRKLSNGARVFKMTMGLSLMYAPFFLLSHLTATIFNLETTGFSPVYQFGLCMATLFYFTLSLIILQKVLKNYFEDKVIAVVLVLICFGTNLFYYVSFESAMSHCYSFFLFACVLYFNLRWHQKPGVKSSVLLGIVIGLTILVRASNIVVLLIPLLFKVNDIASLKLKFIFLKEHINYLAIAAISSFVIWLPQLFYWKYVTDSWLFYSYIEEHFYFTNPHIAASLFSFRKGWFIYTPLMVLFVIGLFYLKEKIRDYLSLIIIFFAANIYLMSSWWCWWYGGSYGLRPMIDCYPLLSIPVAAVIARLYKAKLFFKTAGFILISVFFSWNIYLTYQYKRGVLSYDGMTARAYAVLFHSFRKPHNYRELLSMPDTKAALHNREDYKWK